jgi:hypothetical protein
MKNNILIKKAPPRLMAVALMAAAWVTVAGAQTSLQPRVISRPVVPSDIGDYKLPANTETSGGLSTIAVGTPAYLEAEVSLAFPASNVTSVVWSLTAKPFSSAVQLTNTALGPNVPVYEPADRLVYQVVGARTLLRPDLEGQYTVNAAITTTTGTTNVGLTITAGSYLGWSQGCVACHSGSLIAPNMTSWTNTEHASMFTRSIDTQVGYSKNCISCHTVGYDTNATVFNGGFSQVMAQVGWTFPSVITNGNWAAVPPALKNVANIQCENCHGPGSKHLVFNGVLGNTNTIAVDWNSGNCGQCHDAKSRHINNPEWDNSKHAVTVTTPSGPGEGACVGCHTGIGFAQRMDGVTNIDTSYMPINCAGCHDPHDATNPHQVRAYGSVVLADHTSITNAGTSATCMSCHQARVSATNYVDTTAGNSRFGPHHGPQTDMFMGVNGYTYGQAIPSSAHRDAITNSCVTCHMQATPATTNAGFLLVGGHTFSVIYTNGPTNIEYTAACQQCHGAITSFNLVREDYNGDGIIEGVQTEVQHLLDQLAVLLPPVGQAKSALAIDSTWNKQQLRAAYNYEFVWEDRSHGVHNTAYAVGLLKASIADLTGVPNSTGLMSASDLAFYKWQVQYFGSATVANAAANASPAGDGIPNWLKYSLGLNPTVRGTTNSLGGIVWADGNSLGGNGTNAIAIYTAAEVAFNTQVGTTYQIQAVSSLGDGWQNVGTPIAGTGSAVSYLTPTRKNVQQFFRVVHTP